MSDITDRAASLLGDLGATEIDVARTLKAKGVKGVMGDAYSCPLFNYLVGEGVSVVEVDGAWVEVEGDASVRLPDACREFVNEFDAGNWPELVIKEAE